MRRYRLFSIGSCITILALAIGACRFQGVSQAVTQQAEQKSARSGTQAEELTSGGVTRRYRLHIPSGYQSGQPLPLVINIHGFSSNAAQEEALSRMSLKADAANFFVVYPEGLGSPQAWHFGPGEDGAADLRFMRDLVSRLESQYNIDPSRIYATGISNGAQMTNRMACEEADLVAAVAPVSGGYIRGQGCSPSRPVPVMAFHGTADKLLPYNGSDVLVPIPEWAAAWAQRDGCQSAPTVTYHMGQVTGQTWSGCKNDAEVVLYTIDGAGHSWPGSNMPASITTKDIDATDAMWDFFIHHPK